MLPWASRSCCSGCIRATDESRSLRAFRVLRTVASTCTTTRTGASSSPVRIYVQCTVDATYSVHVVSRGTEVYIATQSSVRCVDELYLCGCCPSLSYGRKGVSCLNRILMNDLHQPTTLLTSRSTARELYALKRSHLYTIMHMDMDMGRACSSQALRMSLHAIKGKVPLTSDCEAHTCGTRSNY